MSNLYQSKYPIPETAEYVVDYVTMGDLSFAYYQLVRLSDDAILCSYHSLDEVIKHCWIADIPHSKVAFI